MPNEKSEISAADELTTADGRKVVAFSSAGESYTVESTEQAAKGESAKIQAELDALKLRSLRRGMIVGKLP
ncbi:MAG: hypothetical protein IJE97_13335 [Thermoguttaceae bacterium]|nr:hypothetical protein [Thermoguttaceae bacterium]